MRVHHDERGQTIILVALSLPFLLGFVGIATDVGALFKDKRTIQTAADAAAIAAAANLNYGTYVASGKTASATNGFTDGSDGVTVTISDPPTWTSSNYYNKTGYVGATVSKTESTIFLSLFGYPSVTVLARAVATLGPGAECAYMLGASGDDVNVSNNATLNFTNCGILDDSSSSNALTVVGSGHLITSSVGIVSTSWTSSDINNGGTMSPASPFIGVVPASDPLSYLTAPSYSTSGCHPALNLNSSQIFNPSSSGGVACYDGVTIGGGATITLNNPGVFVVNGTLDIANGAHITLGSGLYYLTGSFLGQGGTTINGSGVTFYLTGPAGGQINLANGVHLNLSAPNAAGSTCNGMLFWQASSNTNSIIIAGGANSTLKGAIYAPAAQLNISNGASTNIYTDLIVSSVVAAGGTNTNNSYESLSGVAPILTAPLLVE